MIRVRGLFVAAVLVFGLLAASTLPVLRAIGLTVALGVAFHFCLSTQMARPRDKAIRHAD